MPQDPDPFAQIIASRSLTWVDANGNTQSALVEIGCPYPNPGTLPNGPDDPWCCAVRTTGLLADSYQPVFFGIDSLEALLQAISSAAVAVNCVPFSAGLNWAVVPNCGFPIYPAPASTSGGSGTSGGGSPTGGGGGGGATPGLCPTGPDGGDIQLEPIAGNPK